jgi:hypothetical protein
MFEWKDKLLAAAKIAVGVQFPVLSFFFDDIDDLLSSFITISLDDLVEQFSDKTDEVILRVIHEERIIFVGGTMEAHYSNVIKNDVFILHLKLYFQNTNKEFVLKETSKILPWNKIDIASQEKLYREGVVVYQIDVPNSY